MKIKEFIKTRNPEVHPLLKVGKTALMVRILKGENYDKKEKDCKKSSKKD